jgi:hypothetical protein
VAQRKAADKTIASNFIKFFVFAGLVTLTKKKFNSFSASFVTFAFPGYPINIQ